MFTGIVAAVGRIERVDPLGEGAGVRLTVDAGGLGLADVAIGDSIAIQGACMTAISVDATRFVVEVSRESLSKTAGLDSPGEVNLEKALRAGQALGGHYVTGHVDGVGRVVSRHDDARSVRVEFEVPPELARYVARKGSICVDGVSLTVNGVAGNRFDVNLVPHTLEVTILGGYRPGTRVHLEVDIIARYLERLMAPA